MHLARLARLYRGWQSSTLCRIFAAHDLMLLSMTLKMVFVALEYEPHAEQALLQRGRCLMAMGDYINAYADYWYLATLKPDAREPQRQMEAIAQLCPEAPEVLASARVPVLLCVHTFGVLFAVHTRISRLAH